jgi:hypothetical protein
VHQAYLKIFHLGAVGSAYAAMEKHCERGTWEEVLEAVRTREIEFLRGVLEDGGVLQDSTLPAEVRSLLEAVLESYRDLWTSECLRWPEEENPLRSSRRPCGICSKPLLTSRGPVSVPVVRPRLPFYGLRRGAPGAEAGDHCPMGAPQDQHVGV